MNKTIKSLLSSNNEAIIAFTKRDLLGQRVNTKFVQYLPAVQRIVRKQERDGRWVYPSKKVMQRGYDQYQTMKMLGELVQKYELNKSHKSVQKAAKFLFSTQTKEGDFRGIYANQYSPNYSSTIMEFLIMAGYKTDKRIIKGLNWLLSMRQSDGAWAIPIRTCKKMKWTDWVKEKQPAQPDRTKKFSHLVTGIVLRPFSHIKKYQSKVKQAALLYLNRFFERDKYPDRVGVEYWTKFTFPYQWTDILNGLDTLSRMGIKSHPKITKALQWFKQHQRKDGLWKVHKVMGAQDKDSYYWINLQIARVLKRF